MRLVQPYLGPTLGKLLAWEFDPKDLAQPDVPSFVCNIRIGDAAQLGNLWFLDATQRHRG